MSNFNIIYIKTSMLKIIVILAIFSQTLALRSDRLICVQQIVRHGARYPYETIKNEELSQWATKNNLLRDLTKQGKHMHYILGKLLYKQYWKQLFGDRNSFGSISDQIHVFSTNTNRTIQSAQSQLIGLLQDLQPETVPLSELKNSLPPFQGAEDIQVDQSNSHEFYVYGTKNKNSHLIPVHTEMDHYLKSYKQKFQDWNDIFKQDLLVKMSSQNCPNQKQWMEQNFKLDIFKKIEFSDKIKKYLNALSQQLGYPVRFDNKGEAISEINDIARFMGRKSLKIFEKLQARQAAHFVQCAYTYFEAFHSDLQIRTGSTWLLQSFIKNMQKAMKKNGPKLIIYSGHDWTLTSLDCFMDSFYNGTVDQDCIDEFPIFTSNVLIELWETVDGEMIVKIRYNGKLKKIPVCENKSYCTLSEFMKWAETVYLDVNRQCGLPPMQILNDLEIQKIKLFSYKDTIFKQLKLLNLNLLDRFDSLNSCVNTVI